MARLNLSIAIGEYDRVRPLTDGSVSIDGVDPIFMHLEPEEIFFRAFRQQAFDICEMSLSTTVVRTAAGDNPYIAVPVFPSRAFRHTAIYVRTDRGIDTPEDLRGRRIGTPEYQLSANVWARAILAQDYGVEPSQITWMRGGQEQAGRTEKAKLSLPADVRIEEIGEAQTLSDMLAAGEIDGLVAPRAPSCFTRGDPNVGWLFRDPAAAASDWYRRTKVFPIMHVLGVRKTLAAQHPWLPMALYKAFSEAKHIAVERLSDVSAAKATLPFLDEQVMAARRLMGDDYWSYGLANNLPTLDYFLDAHHAQGLSPRRVQAEELFHPSVGESFKI